MKYKFEVRVRLNQVSVYKKQIVLQYADIVYVEGFWKKNLFVLNLRRKLVR